MCESNPDDFRTFENEIRLLRSQVANLTAHGLIDGELRQQYSRSINQMAADLRRQAERGQISWAQAAEEAHRTRNSVMDAIRGRSTPVGRALAEQLKREGRTLNEMIARKTTQLFGSRANFNQLSPAQQNRVYLEIVESAGQANPRISTRMRTLSRASRALLLLSLAVSVYNIAVSDDPGRTAVRETAVVGGGVVGGIAGGALAGLACGPGAPVCVGVGAFVGGVLVAVGVDSLW